MRNDGKKKEELEMRTKGSQAAERSAHTSCCPALGSFASTFLLALLFTNFLLRNVYISFSLSLALTLITLIAFLHKLAYYFRCARRIFFHSSTIITRFFCTCSFRRSHTRRSRFILFFACTFFGIPALMHLGVAVFVHSRAPTL